MQTLWMTDLIRKWKLRTVVERRGKQRVVTVIQEIEFHSARDALLQLAHHYELLAK